MEPKNNILKSFSIQDELNSKIWNISKDGSKMKPEIREKLLEIAYEFIKFLDVDVFVENIEMTGSLSNYNWSEYSDVDLHLIIDFEQFPKESRKLYQELFNLKKAIFNDGHDIKIKGYDVELYAQDIEEPRRESAGVYSVLYDEWVKEPKKENISIDKITIEKKAKQWMDMIDTVIENSEEEDLEIVTNLISKLKEKLKKFRKAGLDKKGEYSNENLVFKYLRRNGYIGKLFDFKNEIMDKKLSLKEKNHFE